MKPDPLSFKRATNVSLIGLTIQIVLALVILLYSIFAQDLAARAAFFYMLVGIPVWLGLALVFHQHRLERLEAVEAELLTSSSSQSSVFGEVDAELRVAAKRLGWMHRILLPILSLIVGGALVGVGLWQFAEGKKVLAPGAFERPGHTGWAVSLGLGVAVLGFIFARFVAGMAKQEAWSNLRAGASYMVGVALVGLALALAHGAAFAGTLAPLQYLHVVLPVFMILLGVEVFLNFVLNIYRPRKPGEAPRPAFDSRVLGFVATPDRFVESISDAINYQFGFDVSSTWFYRLLSRSVISLVVLGALVTFFLSSFGVVGPNEKGLLLQFGRLKGEVGSGLNIKAPWPLQTIETYPALAVTHISVGADAPTGDGAILWTNPHHTEDVYLLVQPTPAASARGAAATRDLSLVSVEVAVQYIVESLAAYRLLAVDSEDAGNRDKTRQDLLRRVAERELIEYAATLTIDDILGARRSEMSAELRRRVERRFDELNAGVRVLFVGVAGAHPPAADEVALSYESVVSAEQRREALVEQARAEATRTLASVAGDAELANRIVAELDRLEEMRDADAAAREVAEQELAIEALLEDAGGAAATRILQARADRWERHMEARGRASRHAGRVALYRAAPQVYTAQLYLDAIRNAARDARVYITTFPTPAVRVNFEENQASINAFDVKSANKD